MGCYFYRQFLGLFRRNIEFGGVNFIKLLCHATLKSTRTTTDIAVPPGELESSGGVLILGCECVCACDRDRPGMKERTVII